MKILITFLTTLYLCVSSSAVFAYKVYGAIGEKWKQLGAESGPLGAPRTDELDAAYGGRFNEFQGGFIYWHPETDAHVVWGEISALWSQLGREQFGYPITDELPTPDEHGRFNHFRAVHLPGKPEASIYWTPETGAHEVYGAIRTKWAELGWERSQLGYPISGEFQEGAYRRSNFQYGFISWSSPQGAVVGLNPRVLETLTDRCSGDVIIASKYSDDFQDALRSGVLLKRYGGNTATPSVLRISGRTWIRWWCNSTTGNWADPGTWRITDGNVMGGCELEEATGEVRNCKPTGGKLSFSSSDVKGWTPERSRCASSGTRYIDARLGSDRLLEIRCWSDLGF